MQSTLTYFSWLSGKSSFHRCPFSRMASIGEGTIFPWRVSLRTRPLRKPTSCSRYLRTATSLSGCRRNFTTMLPSPKSTPLPRARRIVASVLFAAVGLVSCKAVSTSLSPGRPSGPPPAVRMGDQPVFEDVTLALRRSKGAVVDAGTTLLEPFGGPAYDLREHPAKPLSVTLLDVPARSADVISALWHHGGVALLFDIPKSSLLPVTSRRALLAVAPSTSGQKVGAWIAAGTPLRLSSSVSERLDTAVEVAGVSLTGQVDRAATGRSFIHEPRDYLPVSHEADGPISVHPSKTGSPFAVTSKEKQYLQVHRNDGSWLEVSLSTACSDVVLKGWIRNESVEPIRQVVKHELSGIDLFDERELRDAQEGDVLTSTRTGRPIGVVLRTTSFACAACSDREPVVWVPAFGSQVKARLTEATLWSRQLAGAVATDDGCRFSVEFPVGVPTIHLK